MKKIMGLVATLFVIVTIAYLINDRPDVSVEKSLEFENCAITYKTNMNERLNSSAAKFTVAGLDVDRFNYDVYVSDEMVLMVESNLLRSLLSCSVLEYSDGGVIIMKGDNKVVLTVGSNQAMVNDNHIIDLQSVVIREDDKLYIPLDNISEFFSYKVTYDLRANWIDLTRLDGEKLLPSSYDMRDYGRVTPVTGIKPITTIKFIRV